jgi:hypothetical protein
MISPELLAKILGTNHVVAAAAGGVAQVFKSGTKIQNCLTGGHHYGGSVGRRMATGESNHCLTVGILGVWQGMAMDSLKFHPGPPCPTLPRLAGEPTQKRPNGRFMGGLAARRASCGHLLPIWTPHAVRLCLTDGSTLRPFLSSKHNKLLFFSI